jgi:hypothetical protein
MIVLLFTLERYETICQDFAIHVPMGLVVLARLLLRTASVASTSIAEGGLQPECGEWESN